MLVDSFEKICKIHNNENSITQGKKYIFSFTFFDILSFEEKYFFIDVEQKKEKHHLSSVLYQSK